MHAATEEEISQISDYVRSEVKKKVTFVQRVHVENLHGTLHEIWDVHCGKKRYWVVTNPMNQYEQDMFPNMDLVLTFHVGLCLRIALQF